jgi:hypothetical protein
MVVDFETKNLFNTPMNNARFYIQNRDLGNRLFVKPLKGKAICIYSQNKFGCCGFTWSAKELREMGAKEITHGQANEFLNQNFKP